MAKSNADVVVGKQIDTSKKKTELDINTTLTVDVATLNMESVLQQIEKRIGSSSQKAIDAIDAALKKAQTIGKKGGAKVSKDGTFDTLQGFVTADYDAASGGTKYNISSKQAHLLLAKYKNGVNQVLAALEGEDGNFRVYDLISGVRMLSDKFATIKDAISAVSKSFSKVDSEFPVDVDKVALRIAKMADFMSSIEANTNVDDATNEVRRNVRAANNAAKKRAEAAAEEAAAAEDAAKSAQESSEAAKDTSKKKKKKAEVDKKAAEDATGSVIESTSGTEKKHSAKSANITFKAGNLDELHNQIQEYFNSKPIELKFSAGSHGNVSVAADAIKEAVEGLSSSGKNEIVSNVEAIAVEESATAEAAEASAAAVESAAQSSKRTKRASSRKKKAAEEMAADSAEIAADAVAAAASAEKEASAVEGAKEVSKSRRKSSKKATAPADKSTEPVANAAEETVKEVKETAVRAAVSEASPEKNSKYLAELDKAVAEFARFALGKISGFLRTDDYKAVVKNLDNSTLRGIMGLSDLFNIYSSNESTALKAKDAIARSLESRRLGSELKDPLFDALGSLDRFGAGDVSVELFNTISKEFGRISRELKAKMVEAGVQASAGLAEGIKSGEQVPASAASEAAEKTVEAAKRALDEHSPSKRFIKIGKDAVEGFKIGIASMSLDAATTLQKNADNAVKSFETRVRNLKQRLDELAKSGGSQSEIADVQNRLAIATRDLETNQSNKAVVDSIVKLLTKYPQTSKSHRFIRGNGVTNDALQGAGNSIDSLLNFLMSGAYSGEQPQLSVPADVEILPKVDTKKVYHDIEQQIQQDQLPATDDPTIVLGDKLPFVGNAKRPIQFADPALLEYLGGGSEAGFGTSEMEHELFRINQEIIEIERQKARAAQTPVVGEEEVKSVAKLRAAIEGYYTEKARSITSDDDGRHKQRADEFAESIRNILNVDRSVSMDDIMGDPDRLARLVETLDDVAGKQSTINGLQSRIYDGARKVSTAWAEVGDKEEEARKKAADINKDVGYASRELYSQITGFIRSISGIITAAIGSISLNTVFQNVSTLDKAVVNLQIATGFTRKETQGLVESYSDFAHEIGATTSEIANAADGWLRQGYALEKTNDLIRASIELSKLGKISSEEAQRAITATIKGYQMQVEEAESVVDKLTSVDMAAAIDAGEIANGLSKVAAMSKTLGIDLDNLIGYIAQVGQTMQVTGDVAGTGLKSIFGRMAQIKTGKIGEAIIDPETAEDISNVDTTLSFLGVHLRDQKGNFRDFDDVLEETARIWDELGRKGDTTSQAAIANALGGTRMRPYVDALLNGYAEALRLSEISENSTGNAAKKYEAYSESIEAAINRVKSAYENLSQTIMSSDFLASIFEKLSNIVGGIDTITESIGGLTTVLVAFGTSTALKTISTVFSGALFHGAGFMGALSAIKNILPFLGYFGAAVTALVTVVGTINLIKKKIEDSFDWESHAQKAEEAKKEEESLGAQLDTVTQKIADLQEEGSKNGFSLEINNQIALLKQEQRELDENIKKLRELNDEETKKAKKAADKNVEKQFDDAMLVYGVDNSSFFLASAEEAKEHKRIVDSVHQYDRLNISHREDGTSLLDIITGNAEVDYGNIKETRELVNALINIIDKDAAADLYVNFGNASASSKFALENAMDIYRYNARMMPDESKISTLYESILSIMESEEYKLLEPDSWVKKRIDDVLNSWLFDAVRKKLEATEVSDNDNGGKTPSAAIKTYGWRKTLTGSVKATDEIKQEDALAGVIKVLEAEVASVNGIDDVMVGKINPNLADHVAIIAKNDDALQRYIKDWQDGVITSKEFLEVLKNAQEYSLYGTGSTSWDRVIDELDSYQSKVDSVVESREKAAAIEQEINGIEGDIYSGRYELYGSPKEIYSLFDDELAGLASEYSHVAQEAQEHQKELELSKGTVKALTEKYPALTQDIIAYNTAIKAGSSAQAEYNKLISDMKILADQNVASEINSQLSSFMGINDQGSFAAWMLNMQNTLATTGKWKTDDITSFMQVFKDMQGDLSRTSKQDALTRLKDLAKERPDWEPWIKFFDTLFEFEKNHTQYETAFKAIQDFFNSSTPGEKQNAIEQLNDELEQLGVSPNVRKDIYDLLNVATTPAQKKNALQSMLDTLIALGDVNLSSLIEQTKELMKELDPAATERSAARNAQSALSSFMSAKNVADLEDAAIQMRKAFMDSGNFETTNQRDLFFNLIFGDLLKNRDFSPENLFNLSKEAFSKMIADQRFSDWESIFQEMFYSFDAQGNKRTAASNIVGALESYLGIESPDQRDQIARQIKDDLRTAFGEEKATQMMKDIFSPLLNANTFNMSDNGGIITRVLSAMFGTEDFSAFEYLAKDLYKTIADPTVWQKYTSPLQEFFEADTDSDKAKAWSEFIDELTKSGDVKTEGVLEDVAALGESDLDRNSLINKLIELLQGDVNGDVLLALREMRLSAKELASQQMKEFVRKQGGNVEDIAERQIWTYEDLKSAGFKGEEPLSPGDWATINSMTFSSEEFGIEGPETWINVTPFFIGEDGQKRMMTRENMFDYLQGLINEVGLEGLSTADSLKILLGMNNLSAEANEALMNWLHETSAKVQLNPNTGEQYAPDFAANRAANMGYGAKQFGSGFYGSEFGGAFEAFNTLQPGGMLTEPQMQAMIAAMPQLTQEIVAFGQACANSSGDINAWNAAYAKMDEAIREQEGMQRLLDMKQALEDYKKASKDGTIHEQNDALQEMWDILQDMDVDMSKFYDTEGQEDYNKMLEQIKDNAWLIDEAFRNLQRDTFMDIAASYNVDTSQAEAALNAVMNGGLEVSNLSEEVLQKLIATGKFTTDKRELKGKFPYVESLWPFRVSTREFEGEQTILVPTDDNPYKGFKGSKHSGGGGKKGGGGKTSVISEQYTNDKGMYETLIDNLKNLNNLYEEGSEEWLRNQQRIIETYQAYAKTVQDEYDRLVKAGVSMTDKEMQTLAKDLIKVNKEIYDAAKEYWEAVRDNMKESMEHIVDQMDAVLDLRKAHKDLLTELRQENRELEKQYEIAQDEAAHPGLTEAEHELLFSSEDYKRLTGMLQDISKQADALYEEYKNKIASVTEDETYAISYITDEYERQLGLLESQYEIAKQQLAVEKARQELQNTLRERNTAVLINGAWTWMADPDAVQAAMEKVADAEVELEDAITDSEFNKETAEIETARDAIKSSIDAMEALEFAIEDLAEGIVDLADSINENIFNAIGTTSRNYLKQTKGHGLELFMDELTELQETSGLVFSNTDVEKLYSLLSSGNTINSSNIFDDSIVHDSAAIASILSNTTNNTAGAQNVIYINGIQLSDSDSEMLLNALERVSYTWQA